MKTRIALLILSALCPSLFAATGDIIVQKKTATGVQQLLVTPSPSALLGFNGSGVFGTVPGSTFAPASHTQPWSTITATPVTLAEYGITDAQPFNANTTILGNEIDLGGSEVTGVLGVGNGGTGGNYDTAAQLGQGLLTAVVASPSDGMMIFYSGTPGMGGEWTHLNSTTSFGRSVLTRADAAALRTLAGLGTMATQAAGAVNITGGTITGVEIEEMAAYKLASTFATDTLGPAEYGLGFADEKFTLQSPVGALQFYETGSPLESVMYWPGRVVVGTLESTSITGSITGDQVASGSIPGSVMRASMPTPMLTWQDSSALAGANGLTYGNTGPSGTNEATTPGNYFAVIEVTDGGTETVNALAGKIKTHSQMAVPRVVSVPGTATSTGTAGDIAYDSSYLYICTATNTWRRVAITSW